MKISIIIPIYNIEEWIARCITSILEQHRQGVELIIVDDCSEDRSMQIVREMLQDVSLPIQYITHPENRGLSAARNSGIEKAKGDYILFVDGDDTLASDAIEGFYQSIQDGYDVVVGNYQVISESHSYTSQRYSKSMEYCGEKIFIVFVQGWIPIMAWNKLVRREFILLNNLLFKEGVLHEDELWSFMLMLKSRKVKMLGSMTYNYFVRERSIMTSSAKALHKVESMIAILKDMVAYTPGEQPREIVKYLDRFAFKCYLENEKLKSGSFERYREIHHIHKAVKYIGFTREFALTAHHYLPSSLGYLCCRVVSKLYVLR